MSNYTQQKFRLGIVWTMEQPPDETEGGGAHPFHAPVITAHFTYSAS